MKKKNRYITDFLFSKPTMLSGAGTVFNLAGNFYNFNTSTSESEADCKAIRNDFNMVGQDINDVFNKVKNNKKKLVTT